MRIREKLRSRRLALPALGLLLVAAGVALGATVAAALSGASPADARPGPAADGRVEAPEPPQRFGRRGYRGPPPEVPIDNLDYNGRFTFNRVQFTPSVWSPSRRYMWGLDLYWNHDYPRAEQNLMQIIRHLTVVEPNMEGVIYRFDDPELFRYPLAYVSEPGVWTMDDDETESLREYVLKGGFLIFDDFQGYDIYNLQEQIQRVLPGARLQILDTTHPIFHSFFDITQEDILNQADVSIYYGAGDPVIYGVYEDNDPNRRLLMVANHNQDVGESWEFSDSGWIPIELSNNSFKLGVNYVIYSMTQ